MTSSSSAVRLARENPFRSRRVESLVFRLQPGEDWQGLLDRFAALGYRAALIGKKGTGKTTLLEELERRLQAAGWVVRRLRLSEERRTVTAETLASLLAPAVDGRVLVSIDGVEQLSRWRWWRLRQASRRHGLLVTSHQPCNLSVLRWHLADRPLLEGLLDELLGGKTPPQTLARAEQHFAAGGDLRQTLRGLYDDWTAGRIPF